MRADDRRSRMRIDNMRRGDEGAPFYIRRARTIDKRNGHREGLFTTLLRRCGGVLTPMPPPLIISINFSFFFFYSFSLYILCLCVTVLLYNDLLNSILKKKKNLFLLRVKAQQKKNIKKNTSHIDIMWSIKPEYVFQ